MVALLQNEMARYSLALCLLLLTCVCAQAQTVGKRNSLDATSGSLPVTRAINALKRLDQNVIIYRSLGEFEAGRGLASISRKQFESDFQKAAAELGSALGEMPSGKLRNEIINAFNSYRDGLFWWRQVDNQPKVISVSALAGSESARTVSDTTFLATVPYTVAIHWRHAHKYLNQAENSVRN